MKDKLLLDSLDAIRALSDPRRLELLKQLVVKQMTAAELAETIGEEKSKLYYHLGELENHGLIDVVETRKKRNFLEKVYRATARYYSVDRTLFSGDHGMEVFFSTVTSILDTTAADIHRLIETGEIDGDSIERVHQGHRRIEVTEERRAEFSERLEALIEEFSREQPEDDQQERSPYLISFVVYPDRE